MSIPRTTLTVPALLGAVLVFAGCASSPAPDATPSGDSPLTPYLAALFGAAADPNSTDKGLAEQQKKQEAFLATCMKEKGFDYIPNVSPESTANLAAGDDWKPDDRSWVAQNGYGMFRAFEQMTTPTQADPDPNATYLESLSETERRAWEDALYGALASEDAPQEYDPTKAGCMGEALQQAGADSDEFADLCEAATALQQEMTSAPEAKQADSEWSACMATAGYSDLTTQREASMNISQRWIDLLNDPATQSDQSAREKLKQDEIDTALADLDCRTTTRYTERVMKVRWEAEEKFVAEHKSELEAAKAAAEQAS